LAEVILHLGTNLGYRAINLELVSIMISNHIGDIISESHIYETEAWGNTDQNDFLNQAMICNTTLSPHDILSQIQVIEAKMGRQKIEHWGPRIIDIDIIFYEQEIIENPNLKIPHPQLTNRNFVLRPLMDICPEHLHPVLNKSVKELVQECEDKSKVVIYK